MKQFFSLFLAAILVVITSAGAFTTTAEVKPILNATKSNWIGVRAFNGHDLVYFTQIEAWRCGLDGVKYGINSDTADQTWTLEKCYENEGSPNAMQQEGRLPYITLPAGSVKRVTIKLIYDDGTTDQATFQRDAVKIP